MIKMSQDESMVRMIFSRVDDLGLNMKFISKAVTYDVATLQGEIMSIKRKNEACEIQVAAAKRQLIEDGDCEGDEDDADNLDRLARDMVLQNQE